MSTRAPVRHSRTVTTNLAPISLDDDQLAELITDRQQGIHPDLVAEFAWQPDLAWLVMTLAGVIADQLPRHTFWVLVIPDEHPTIRIALGAVNRRTSTQQIATYDVDEYATGDVGLAGLVSLTRTLIGQVNRLIAAQQLILTPEEDQ